MKTRRLGLDGPVVSSLGLGCMGMSEFYGVADDGESRDLLFAALERGITLFDTADCYGDGHNERLLGSVLREWGGEVCVASKFGIVRRPGEYRRTIDNSPAYIRASIEGSLSRLGRERIDLYYVHRLDPAVPIEETVGCLSGLVKEGKLRWIGLSEASARIIERAHSTHPIAAVQSEYSLFTRDVECDVLPTLGRLGIGFVPYSPLGRGMLTGHLTQEAIHQEGDFRSRLPRTNDENFGYNEGLVGNLGGIATEQGLSTAQLALAWILSTCDYAVPIPGTRSIERLGQNIAAIDAALDSETIRRIEAIFPPGVALGARYTEEGMVGIEA